MTVEQWLKLATVQLASSEVKTAHLDALILLEDETNKDRALLLAHPEYDLTNNQISTLNDQIERRAKHEPLAYIRGKSEFFGREFIVDDHTLEPRPETETMIDCLEDLGSRTTTIVDVGTGSGAIAITAKLELTEQRVFGTDIDNKCIQAAEANAKKHNVSIDFRHGSLLKPIENENLKNWIILANLPYVPDSHTINEAATFEPKHAIFGGADGLDLYKEMFAQINSTGNKPACILTESLPSQHDDLAEIAKKSNYELQRTDDFIQWFCLS